MNTSEIKKFAVQANKIFLDQIKSKALLLGFSDKGIADYHELPNEINIDGRIYPKEQWKEIFAKVKTNGTFDKEKYLLLIDEVAYTWFNRFMALKFMEENEYVDFRFVVSSSEKWFPDVMTKPEETGLIDKMEAVKLKLENKSEELYRKLLTEHCHNLNKIMPFMFETVDDYTELLLPDNLLSANSIISFIDKGLDSKYWQDVEVIGWLYQFYISEKKDKVIGSKKAYKKEDIPAATQLFTPRWIVDYLTQNSLGRIWMESYPESSVKNKMNYYVDSDVDTANEYYKKLNPEEIKVIDPSCGSGHILIRMFDLLMNFYKEYGYTSYDAVKNIVEKNLYGLDIDKRATQLACFAVIMKCRQYAGSKALKETFDLNIMEIEELTQNQVDSTEFIKSLSKEEKLELEEILSIFIQAKNYGSLIRITTKPIDRIDYFIDIIIEQLNDDFPMTKKYANIFYKILKTARILIDQYDAVVTNPPYMGNKTHNKELKTLLKNKYPDSKSDLFAAFMERGFDFLKDGGFEAMITMQSWMFLSSYEKLRKKILDNYTIVNMLHLGTRAFKEIGGEVVQTVAFVIRKRKVDG